MATVFAPVLLICGYDPENLNETIPHINSNKYALINTLDTRNQVHFNKFNNTCGNHFNDKSTGSIVGQQIFGGFQNQEQTEKQEVNILPISLAISKPTILL